mgnify:CR=1 FL=1
MSTRAPFFAAVAAVAAATVAGGFSAAIASPPAVEERLLGFSAEASRAELRREQRVTNRWYAVATLLLVIVVGLAAWAILRV